MTDEINATRIQSLAKQIEELQEAKLWLIEHGDVLHSKADKDVFSIHFQLNLASALRGAKEAQKQLSSISRLFSADIVDFALKDCSNTIELLRSQIEEEVVNASQSSKQKSRKSE